MYNKERKSMSYKKNGYIVRRVTVHLGIKTKLPFLCLPFKTSHLTIDLPKKGMI